MAKQVLEDGERVLWAAPEMPDPTRFSQVLVASTHGGHPFHAMNLVGNGFGDEIAPASRDVAAWCGFGGHGRLGSRNRPNSKASFDALSNLASGLGEITLLATRNLVPTWTQRTGSACIRDQLIEAGFASWRLTVEPSGVRLLEGRMSRSAYASWTKAWTSPNPRPR